MGPTTTLRPLPRGTPFGLGNGLMWVWREKGGAAYVRSNGSKARSAKSGPRGRVPWLRLPGWKGLWPYREILLGFGLGLCTRCTLWRFPFYPVHEVLRRLHLARQKSGEARSGGGPRGTGSNPWIYFFLIMANNMEVECATERVSAQSKYSRARPSGSTSWANMVEETEKSQTVNLPNQQINNSARFFFIKRNDGSFEKTSPFLIQKCMQSYVGEVKNIKKVRSGDILVEVADDKQSEKIQKLNNFAYCDVTISPHNSLNISRGVISEPDLLYCPEEEIVSNLENQNVSYARRITIKRDGKIIPTKHIILTFQSPKIPSHVTAGYLKCSVRPYIPNPLRCFQCQRYGHSKNSCRGTLTCARCSAPGHDSEQCEESPKCVNCEGNHPSYATSCPKYKIEKEVQTVRVTQNMSYQDARRIVETRTPKSGFSYAAASAIKQSVNPVMISIAIQTDMLNQNLIMEPVTLKVDQTTTHSQSLVSKSTLKKGSGNTAPPPQSKKNSKKKQPVTKLENRLKKEKPSFYKSKPTIYQKSQKRNDDEDEMSLSASDLSDDVMEDAAGDSIPIEKANQPLSKFFR